MATASEAQNPRLEWIRSRRERTEARAQRTRRANSRAVYVSLLTSTAATALAGFAAAAGAPIGSWRVTCGLVAVLTFFATLASGLQKQLDLSGNHARLSTCVGKLAALEYAAAMGTRSLAEIDAECEELMRQFPEALS